MDAGAGETLHDEYIGQKATLDLLTKWHMPLDVIDSFRRNKISSEHFSKLTQSELKELCPILGVRLELKEHIDQFLESFADTLTNTSGTEQSNATLVAEDHNGTVSLDSFNYILDSADFQNLTSVSVTDFDLKTLLLTSPLGKSVLNYYNTYGRLDLTRRNRLTDVIARHMYTHAVNQKVTYDDYNSLAGKIITLFPTENIGTYFVRPVPKSQSKTGKSIFAKGKLLDKIRNLIYKSGDRKRASTSIESGHISKLPKTNHNKSINEDIVWLKNNHEPWDLVIQKWINTYDERVLCEQDNLTEFLAKWPILNDLRSETLINIDFDHMYPGKSTIFYTNWVQFFEKIRAYKRDSLSDGVGKLLDEAITLNANESELDCTIPMQITLLGHLIPPKGRIGKKWKFSTVEAIEGLLIHVKKPGEIEDAITSQKKKALAKKQTVQPYVLVQGVSLDNIQATYIVVDKLRYSFTSTCKAFDTLFKLYHTFNCRYPAPSEHLYLLIQQSVYGIKTEYDKVIVFSGDNLGIHSVFGLSGSFSAQNYCRFCTIPKNECINLCEERQSSLRKETDYNNHLEAQFGLKEKCIWHDLHDFHIYKNLTCDVMHDLCEGVHRYSMAFIIEKLIIDQYFSLETLNSRIKYFTYQSFEKNVPAEITRNHLINGCIIVSASEMLCLVRNFVYMVGDLIPVNNLIWENYLQLREITDILMAQVVSQDMLAYLRTLIEEHHSSYLTLYGKTLKPKYHFLTHYCTIIEKIGPPVLISAFKFEAKHRHLKKVAQSISSRKNLPYSLAVRCQYQHLYRVLSQTGLEDRVKYGKTEAYDLNIIPEYLKNYKCYCYTWYEINGVKYSSQDSLVYKYENDNPLFYKIDKVIIPQLPSSNVYFFCRVLKTLGYCSHLQSFKVENTTCFAFIEKSDCFSSTPLMIHEVSGMGNFISL